VDGSVTLPEDDSIDSTGTGGNVPGEHGHGVRIEPAAGYDQMPRTLKADDCVAHCGNSEPRPGVPLEM
jgi:hypothetical protein